MKSRVFCIVVNLTSLKNMDRANLDTLYIDTIESIHKNTLILDIVRKTFNKHKNLMRSIRRSIRSQLVESNEESKLLRTQLSESFRHK